MARSSSRARQATRRLWLVLSFGNRLLEFLPLDERPARGRARGAQQRPPAFRPPLELTESVTAFGTISIVPSTRAPSSIVVIRRCARGAGGAHAGLIWAVSQPVPEVVARWAKQRIVPSPSRSILGVVPGKQGKWRVRTQWLAIAIRDLGQARAGPDPPAAADKEHQRAADDSHSAQGIRRVGIGPLVWESSCQAINALCLAHLGILSAVSRVRGGACRRARHIAPQPCIR